MAPHKEKFSDPVVADKWKYNRPSFENLKVPSFVIQVSKVNQFAPVISYYSMKVQKSSSRKFTRAFSPVCIYGNSSHVRLRVSSKEKRFVDHLLGDDIEAKAVLKCNDEIGRVFICFFSDSRFKSLLPIYTRGGLDRIIFRT
jgi:hypothetical protein